MLLRIKQPGQIFFENKFFIKYFLPSELYKKSEEALAFLKMLTLQEANEVLCSLTALWFLCAACTLE